MGPLPEDYFRAAARSKLAMPADEIRMEVRLENPADAQALPACLIDVLIHVALRIDDRSLATAADQVGGVCQTAEVELPEVHGWVGLILLLVSFGVLVIHRSREYAQALSTRGSAL